MKKLILSFLAGTAFYFLFGWLIFEGLLGTYMSDNTIHLPGFRKDDDPSGLLFLILSCSAYAALLVVLLGVWTKTYSFADGFKKGAVTGTLVAIMADAYWYGTSHFYSSIGPVFADVCAAALTVGFTGGIISKIVGYKKP